MKVYCAAVVGDVAGSFAVEVEGSATVGELVDAIKRKRPSLDCGANELQLFVAKREEDGAWVKEKGLSDLARIDLTASFCRMKWA